MSFVYKIKRMKKFKKKYYFFSYFENNYKAQKNVCSFLKLKNKIKEEINQEIICQ